MSEKWDAKKMIKKKMLRSVDKRTIGEGAEGTEKKHAVAIVTHHATKRRHLTIKKGLRATKKN